MCENQDGDQIVGRHQVQCAEIVSSLAAGCHACGLALRLLPMCKDQAPGRSMGRHQLECAETGPPPALLCSENEHPAAQVHKAMFIEPATAAVSPLAEGMYEDIEAVWNHHNYWLPVPLALPAARFGDAGAFALDNPAAWVHLLEGTSHQVPLALGIMPHCV